MIISVYVIQILKKYLLLIFYVRIKYVRDSRTQSGDLPLSVIKSTVTSSDQLDKYYKIPFKLLTGSDMGTEFSGHSTKYIEFHYGLCISI